MFHMMYGRRSNGHVMIDNAYIQCWTWAVHIICI